MTTSINFIKSKSCNNCFYCVWDESGNWEFCSKHNIDFDAQEADQYEQHCYDWKESIFESQNCLNCFNFKKLTDNENHTGFCELRKSFYGEKKYDTKAIEICCHAWKEQIKHIEQPRI